MKKIIPLLVLPFLVSFGGQEVAAVTEELPTYCISDAVFLDEDNINGRVSLDMPGYPHGQDDAPIEISRQTYNTLDVEVCKSNDPRSK